MSARLLTGDEKLAYVRRRNAALDRVRGLKVNSEALDLPRYEAHLYRSITRDGVQGYDTAIVVGDDRNEVCELALSQDYPSRTLYDAPLDLVYLGEISRRGLVGASSARSFGGRA
jgi:hypothetical protein